MQIGNVAQAASGQSATPQDQSSNQLTGNDFMTLLVAQLKAQDPLNPMNPNEMMGQLVQFNSLEQMILIRQDIERNQASGASGLPFPPSVNPR